MANDASSVLSIARGELGYSRWDDPEPGTKYGRWYERTIDCRSDNYDFGASGVPYCAMFASWVFVQAGASCAGLPGAYCPSMLSAGRAAAVPARGAQPGDIVYFDWGGDGIADHVGIVESNTGSHLLCIEGNTNNGRVARRVRGYDTVIGVVRPAWGAAGGLDEDGIWGPAVTRRLQACLGTEVDGEVSDQYIGYKAANPGLSPAAWEWRPRTGDGSDVIRALQRKVGANPNGIAGPETFGKLQAYLGTEVDGYISKPSDAVKEMQRRLNAGTF